MSEFSDANRLLRQLSRNTIAAAIYREAARLTEQMGGGKRITPLALQMAVDDYQRVLEEMDKKGF